MVFLLLLALALQLPEPSPSTIVAGRVVDAATGRPVAGAIVTPAGSAVPTSPGSSGPGAALTNAEGHFVLRGLAKGSLVLTATKGGYVNATHGQRRPGGSAQPILLETAQRVPDLEVRMWKYGAITGTIVDEAGDLVVGTRVSVLQKTFVAGRRRFRAGPATAGAIPGKYRLTASFPGSGRPGGWLLKSVIVGGQDSLDAPFTLQPNQHVLDATITFADRLARYRARCAMAPAPPPPTRP